MSCELKRVSEKSDSYTWSTYSIKLKQNEGFYYAANITRYSLSFVTLSISDSNYSYPWAYGYSDILSKILSYLVYLIVVYIKFDLSILYVLNFFIFSVSSGLKVLSSNPICSPMSEKRYTFRSVLIMNSFRLWYEHWNSNTRRFPLHHSYLSTLINWYPNCSSNYI